MKILLDLIFVIFTNFFKACIGKVFAFLYKKSDLKKPAIIAISIIIESLLVLLLLLLLLLLFTITSSNNKLCGFHFNRSTTTTLHDVT